MVLFKSFTFTNVPESLLSALLLLLSKVRADPKDRRIKGKTKGLYYYYYYYYYYFHHHHYYCYFDYYYYFCYYLQGNWGGGLLSSQSGKTTAEKCILNAWLINLILFLGLKNTFMVNQYAIN